MDRVVVFVDAGYVFAAGGLLVSGRRVSRSALELNVEAVEKLLRTFSETETGMPLLRIYWYDGTDSGPTTDHTRLMWTQNVKVRLGIVNTFGQQKGVDSLVVSDMINMSRSNTVGAAVLITGDEDLRVGVQQAQEAGLRVHLVGIEPVQQNQSNMLQQEADVRHEWGIAEVGQFLTERTLAVVPPVHVAAGASRDVVIAAVAQAVVDSLDPQIRAALKTEFSSGVRNVPREHDVILIRTLDRHLQVVGGQDKIQVRQDFRKLV